MKTIGHGLLLFATIACHAAACGAGVPDEFFETRVRPVLIRHCYECHSAAATEAGGGLRLDYRGGWQRGGDSGPAVVPGRPQESLLIEAVRHQSLEMPPDRRLPEAVVRDLEHWIREGAVDPRAEPPSARDVQQLAWKTQLQERREWWSLQAPMALNPPEVTAADWAREPIDRFIWRGLKDAGLEPAPPAIAAVLVRRMSIVLLGLPPSINQTRRFQARFSVDPDRATIELVDELLSSPHFGERMARHWMDVVRYTDTYGYEWDNPAKGSWEYRDYLVRAFNQDIGFDQLIREQIAGDLLPQPRLDQSQQANESLIGPMFFHLGEHRHGTSLDFNGIHQEMINNKIDAFSKAFLATTVACARCHDHKLDAVSQRDYYALAGVIMTPRWTTRAIDTEFRHQPEIGRLKELREQVRTQLAEVWQATSADAWSQRLQLWIETNAERQVGDVPVTPGDLLLRAAQFEDSELAESDLGAAWSALAQKCRAEMQRRQSENQSRFQSVWDFSTAGLPDGWTVEGAGMEHGYVAQGEPLVSLEGQTAIRQLLPRGYHTHALSSRLPGAVRMPDQQELSGQFVSVQVRGGEWAGYLIIPENAFQTEYVTFLDASAPTSWRSIADNGLKNGVTRVRAELATSSLNPNFPPRTGKARAGKSVLKPEDDGFGKRSWFSLTGIIQHDTAGTPLDELQALAPLLLAVKPSSREPSSRDELWRQLGTAIDAAIQRWARREATESDVELLNWLLSEGLLENSLPDQSQLASSVQLYRDVEARITEPRTVNSMDERVARPVNYRLNIRGDVDREADPVPRGFLEVSGAFADLSSEDGSGRLRLAEYLASERNPQTARVYVNRVWQWVFGTGLVATPNDFGRLGERPSHPELLDWLACQFVSERWSTKQLIRRLVLSRTFRQSGEARAEAQRRDPSNRLLHHYPLRRSEAEVIRDSMLFVSGRFDPSLGGPPINPPRPADDAAKRLFSGPLDGNGRRSLYLKMAIMDPPRFLVSFDLPDLKLPTGHRDVTNGPAQALVLLNDPLPVELADCWATQLISDESQTVERRIRKMFLAAYAREATADEVARWSRAVDAFATSDDVLRDQQAWAEVAHALFNTTEFLYYR